MAALRNSLTSKGPLNRAHTYKAAVVATARPDATPTTATRAGVQVETAASTTAAVAGTTFDVPLDTRVKERASPAGARRARVVGYRDREIIRRREPSGSRSSELT